ncbi:CBS domain-containing protein [Mycobacterium sp. SM1]|uniref:CBS domain-containing protein n=1 Tax=Mycobacterium sp. SM1 TaxID=2816243 RepID=UPI001BD06F26|nr:CBS domain-containing protein [Mycobacterium sp. SM1]MBS4730726.1 CBS domain-containing protein [Mycobacterium sp. SM1]
MTMAKDIMHRGVTYVGEHETVAAAARHMRDFGVGALPIWGDDNRLHGLLTDRDIVVKCIAVGRDPNTTTAGELAQGRVYHIGGEATIEQMLTMMEEHRVRRLPVIENHRLIGIVSEADIARHLPEHAIAEFVKAIYAP